MISPYIPDCFLTRDRKGMDPDGKEQRGIGGRENIIIRMHCVKKSIFNYNFTKRGRPSCPLLPPCGSNRYEGDFLCSLDTVPKLVAEGGVFGHGCPHLWPLLLPLSFPFSFPPTSFIH